jgi:hypothetical protein
MGEVSTPRYPVVGCFPVAARSAVDFALALVLDRRPLPLGELLPIGRPAGTRAVSGGSGPSERNMGFVGDGLVVDAIGTPRG